MSKDHHKIDADDRNVFDVLNERKYTVDLPARIQLGAKAH